MKFPKLSTVLACSSALLLTSITMFVMVDAAAAQQEFPAPPAAGVEAIPVPLPADEVPPVPGDAGAEPVAETATGDVVDELLPPEEVLHDRQQRVVLDGSGGFSGQLSSLDANGDLKPVANMNVRVLSGGVSLKLTTTNQDGIFSVTGLSEGVVAILGYNDSNLSLYGVRLVAGENALADETKGEVVPQKAATPVKFTSENAELALQTAVVGPADVGTIRQLIFGALPDRDRRFNAEPTAEEESYSFGEGPAATSLQHRPVALRPDGTLQGQANLMDDRTGRLREIMDLTLHFVRNGQHVAATEVQPDGSFQIAGLTPGTYSIATTGSDGILAMGISIVGPLAVADLDQKFKMASVAQSLDLCVAPANAENFNQQNADEFTDSDSETPGQGGQMGVGGPIGGPAGGGPIGGGPGGGVGGGTGGGGGGVGGGGGLGALLAGAAAGALGYYLGKDDEPASRDR